ncbi:LuxR C-terminal-related transcriptional regulator [Amycolatopsis sp. OK19-0408]|uniref:LuxR C-terminal-related transcriptional regulator n=1 Tax=Amycolatopsis iheyensis TaxID=2945988 RepID=A0A9X2NFJ7_9PSEU|nr:LuxR family transcriptional regulator [Amycolatopsis iheyensis]MCR6487814.1 LuxR C-terminal-related transcriptional regulator [Amycolatopsis iheyensis]
MRATGTTLADGGFAGRSAELAALADVAGKVRVGAHHLVRIEGAAGIGKSALARRFFGGLADFRLLWALGDPAETASEFGLVDQLVLAAPAGTGEALPLLGGRRPPGVDPLAVGRQLHTLVADLLVRSPVALLLDGVDWADRPSLTALGFVLRRSWANQLLVVALSRTDEHGDGGGDPLGDGPAAVRIQLAGLAGPEFAELARSVVGQAIPAKVAERLWAYTGGHPGHLHALLREVEPEELATGELFRTTPRSAVAAARSTLAGLPDATRELLAALAVLGVRSPLARVAQVAGVEQAVEALQPALEGGLVTWWPREVCSPVDITGDVRREAVYTALVPAHRRRLHLRAADAVDRASSWRHRVAAVAMADVGLAAELEATAQEEADRGEHGLAATYLGWAADICPSGPDSERLLLTSVVHLLLGEERWRAARAQARVVSCGRSALRSLCEGLVSLFGSGDRVKAERDLAAALCQAETEDAPRWVRAAAAAGLAGALTWRGEADSVIEHARLALALGGAPVVLEDFARVLLAVARGRRDGLPSGLLELAHLPEEPADVPAAHLDSLACRGALHVVLGRLGDAKRDLEEVLRRAHAGVPFLSGTCPHSYLTAVHYQAGDWDAAASTVAQVLSVSALEEQPTNQALCSLAATLVPAGRGEWTTAAAHVRRAAAAAGATGALQDLRYAGIAGAVLAQAKDDPAAMLSALTAVPGLSEGAAAHEWWSLWWRPLLVEALVGTGRLEEASAQLTAFAELADGVECLRSTTVRLTAAWLAGRGEYAAAVACVEDSYAAPSALGRAPADGMLCHDQGRRLVGAGRRLEGLRWLGAARACFAALGAVPFERRLEANVPDLPRTTSADVVALAGLTDRESEVARLIGKHLTNREIAAEIFVTVKTVEFHLGNIYAKLGLGSRKELRELVTGAAARSA